MYWVALTAVCVYKHFCLGNLKYNWESVLSLSVNPGNCLGNIIFYMSGVAAYCGSVIQDYCKLDNILFRTSDAKTIKTIVSHLQYMGRK